MCGAVIYMAGLITGPVILVGAFFASELWRKFKG